MCFKTRQASTHDFYTVIPILPKNDAKISPLCICQNDNLEMIQLVSTEHEKMDDENPRNNLLTRIKSMRHGSNGSVRASGRTGTTNSSIVSGQAHRCRPCLFFQILSRFYPDFI